MTTRTIVIVVNADASTQALVEEIASNLRSCERELGIGTYGVVVDGTDHVDIEQAVPRLLMRNRLLAHI